MDALVPARALAVFEDTLEVDLELGMLTRYPVPAGEVDTAGAVSPHTLGRSGTVG